MVAEILDEAPDDAETIVISWLKPMLADGHVANVRRAGDPLPFYLVNNLDTNETVEISAADALVSVHVLVHRAAGEVALRDEANRMHRRMLLLARWLEDVDLAAGRIATIDSVSVAKAPNKTEPYGDDQILRRIGRYGIGLPYAKI